MLSINLNYVFPSESTIYDDFETFFDLSSDNSQDQNSDIVGSDFASLKSQSKSNLSVIDEDKSDDNDNDSSSNSNSTNKSIKQKRGRKSDIIKAQHTKGKNDCRMAKIQASYFTFLISFLNLIMKQFKLKYHFFQLKGKYKSNINQKFRAFLNKKTIVEILKEAPISPKYKNVNNSNINIINKLIEEGQGTLLNILDKNFLYFFDNIYFKNLKKFNLSSFEPNPIEVNLPQNIKLFKDLLNKNKNDENFNEYKVQMEKCAKKYFLLNEQNLINNI